MSGISRCSTTAGMILHVQHITLSAQQAHVAWCQAYHAIGKQTETRRPITPYFHNRGRFQHVRSVKSEESFSSEIRRFQKLSSVDFWKRPKIEGKGMYPSWKILHIDVEQFSTCPGVGHCQEMSTQFFLSVFMGIPRCMFWKALQQRDAFLVSYSEQSRTSTRKNAKKSLTDMQSSSIQRRRYFTYKEAYFLE